MLPLALHIFSKLYTFWPGSPPGLQTNRARPRAPVKPLLICSNSDRTRWSVIGDIAGSLESSMSHSDRRRWLRWFYFTITLVCLGNAHASECFGVNVYMWCRNIAIAFFTTDGVVRRQLRHMGFGLVFAHVNNVSSCRPAWCWLYMACVDSDQ